MKSKTMKMLAVAVAIVLVPAVATYAAPFVDTFETFTPDVTVSGQGSWGTIYGPAEALVRDTAGLALGGTQFLNLKVDSAQSTYPFRSAGGTALDATGNVASFGFRIGDRFGPTPNEQVYDFYWATGPGFTAAHTAIWENGTLTYFAPGETNSGVLINQDEWYISSHTYQSQAGQDTINWVVTRVSTDTAVLDVTFPSLAPDNQVTTLDLEWNPRSFAVGSGYNALIDNVSISPEPASFLLMLMAGGMMSRRRGQV